MVQLTLPGIISIPRFERMLQHKFERMLQQHAVSLDATGVEETDEPLHGIHHSNEGSIYSYTDWFYDSDESAFATI